MRGKPKHTLHEDKDNLNIKFEAYRTGVGEDLNKMENSMSGKSSDKMRSGAKAAIKNLEID